MKGISCACGGCLVVLSRSQRIAPCTEQIGLFALLTLDGAGWGRTV